MIWYFLLLIVGFILGLLFENKVLDKPETVQKINKQKVRKGGLFKNIFNRKKRNNNV